LAKKTFKPYPEPQTKLAAKLGVFSYLFQSDAGYEEKDPIDKG